MFRLTFCAIALISTVTATAYFYLPSPPSPPTTATATKPPSPTPTPGNRQDRFYRERTKQPPETFVPLGLLIVGVLWLRTVKS
jgi:hypothetical protein